MDTIVYRLHNPDSYPIILKSVQALEKGSGLMLVNATDEAIKQHKKFSQLWYTMRSNFDSYIIMSHRVKANLPSSATGVMINYDKQKDFIQFEFSAPKFFFGNNVVELIPPPQSKYYGAGRGSMLDLCTDFWYRLIPAIFYKVIVDLTRNKFSAFQWHDVELRRLDITFNQIFDTPENARHYFDAMKRVRLPRLSDGASFQEYDGTIASKSRDYYFKAYLKGQEFSKISKSQIIKNYEAYEQVNVKNIPDALVCAVQNTEPLQNFADRIIRYELECRNALMSTLFNDKLKKRKVVSYQKLVKCVFYLMRPENKNIIPHIEVRYRDVITGEFFKKKPVHLTAYNLAYFLPASMQKAEGFQLIEVTDNQLIKRIERILSVQSYLKTKFQILSLQKLKAVYKILRKEHSKRHQFMLALPPDTADAAKAEYTPNEVQSGEVYTDYIHFMTHLEETPIKQRFSKNILRLLIQKHNTFFEALQLSELPDSSQIEQAAIQYNRMLENNIAGERKHKINVRRIGLLVETLKNTTFDELRKSGRFDRRTLYNWKKDLDILFNLDKKVNFVQGLSLTNVARSAEDMYLRHYMEIMKPDCPINIFQQITPLLLSF